MTASRYTLAIQYRSNERPFSTVYDPSPYCLEDDMAARRWAAGMREGMPDYNVTLLKDGIAMDDQE
jgi:hypothetical protein